MPGGGAGWIKIWPAGCGCTCGGEEEEEEEEVVDGGGGYWLGTVGGTGRTVTPGPGGIVGVRERERLEGL